MGRFPNIAAAKQKTGAARGKLYGMYAREIYQVAKTGGTSPDGNLRLKRLIEKAKKEQVPSEVIKRAIDKVNSGTGENYETVTYEVFGPASSTLLVQCLTDNVNRSISDVRAVVNKCHVKLGAQGSVAYMYDNLCTVAFRGLNEEEVMDSLIMNDIDIEDIEVDNGQIIVYGAPQDLFKIKETITGLKSDIEFELDEISLLPKERIILTGEDLDEFKKLYDMLDNIDDVQNIYHNVEE